MTVCRHSYFVIRNYAEMPRVVLWPAHDSRGMIILSYHPRGSTAHTASLHACPKDRPPAHAGLGGHVGHVRGMAPKHTGTIESLYRHPCRSARTPGSGCSADRLVVPDHLAVHGG